MGVRAIIRDFFHIYIGISLIGVWLFDKPFTNRLGFFIIIMILLAVWFQIERFGFLPKL